MNHRIAIYRLAAPIPAPMAPSLRLEPSRRVLVGKERTLALETTPLQKATDDDGCGPENAASD
jgi:hypothetical protein